MTGADITTYPVASMNDKDYFNLMHVYLDAVFNPLVYDDPRIFKQEGWHRELTDKEGEIVYKGVVYNEMKGAFSDPTSELNYQVNKHLFPDNTYGVCSGGYPGAIPELTYEDFINFHKKFYHPSNSYILLYGNADLEKELQFIDTEYLIKYEKSDKKVEIPLQEPFDQMKVVEKTYAVPDGSSTENKTYLSLSFVAGKNTDRTLCMAFDVLSEALVNHESAPLRLAIQEAGIGRDIRASFNESQQNVFEIIVQNANSEDKDKFKEIIFNTLRKVASEGLDKSMVEGILNRMEFNLKEGNTPQKGLRYLMMSYPGWFFNNDPFLGLEFNKPLEKVKTALETDLLKSTIKEYLISNSHALLMVLTPQPGLQKEINKRTVEELAAYKSTLDDKGL
ncbi:MAG: insulinase family protein, partial [Bacteroidales bacterium]|nr:insulinase family protein [Bacteroidales bacterium]